MSSTSIGYKRSNHQCFLGADAFLMDEVRAGHYVRAERKKLWFVLLDVFDHFAEVCNQLGVKFFADAGTLLGAARHGGFIPWDDDLDVTMPWEDYKILLEEGPRRFRYPYFFQSYQTEKECEPTLSMLRRSDTTGCTKYELECISDPAYNKGMGIDIFPLFNVPDDEGARMKQIEEIMYWWRLYKGYEVHRERTLTGLSRLSPEYEPYEDLYLALDPPMGFAEIKEKYIEACARETAKTERVAQLSFRANQTSMLWKREWFDGCIGLPFEGRTMPCPQGYLKLLSRRYGQWQVFEKNGALHEPGIYDAEVPYTIKLQTRSGEIPGKAVEMRNNQALTTTKSRECPLS